MNVGRIGWALASTVLLAAALSAQGAPESLDSLRARTAAAERRVTALAEQRARAGVWADTQYRAIAEARRRNAGAGELRTALRAAQAAADSLAALDRGITAAARDADAARKTLAPAVQAELERTVAAAERARPPERTTLTARARALTEELQRIRRPVTLPATDLPAVVVRPTDGPAEIALKADFLADRAAQLRSAADVLATEITRERRRAELQDEVERLVEQTRLFGETDVPPPAVPSGGQGGEPRPVDTPVPLDPARGATAEPSGDPRAASDRLARLRADLLRRATALERQSGEVRGMLRGRP